MSRPAALSDRTPNTLALDFSRWVSCLALARGIIADAAHFAADAESPRVLRIAKDAAEAGTTSDASWAGALADHQIVSAAFVESLRHSGVFDRHAMDAVPAPVRTRLVIVTGGAEGDAPDEAGLKLITSLGLAGGVIPAKKSHCEVIISEEVARLGGPLGLGLLDRELRGGVSTVTDNIYLNGIAAGATELAASGTDSEAFLYDLGRALAAIASGDEAKFHIVLPSALAKSMSTMTDPSGSLAFPDLGPDGGTIGSIPVEVSDGLTGYGSPELPAVLVVDASQVAADTGMVLAASSNQATVTIAGETISLFQKNLLASRIERIFGFEPMRDAIAAVITGAAFGPAESSP